MTSYIRKKRINSNAPSKKAGAKNNNNSKIEYGTYKYSVAEIFKYGAIGLAGGLFICWLCYHSLYSLPLAVVVMLVYLRIKKKSLLEERKKRLRFHFKDFLGALHTALSAGYSVENAVAEVMGDMRKLFGENDIITKEIRAMLFGLKLGTPIEELMDDLAKRSGVDDIILFSELLYIGKRQGGRLGKIIGDVKHIICGKIETEQEIDKQISAKKYEQKIMCLMPACVIVYMRLTFDGFIEQLYGNPAGAMIMSICLAIYLCGCYVSKKVISIEV